MQLGLFLPSPTYSSCSRKQQKKVAKHLVFTLPIKQFEHRVTGLWPDANQGCLVIFSPDSFTVSQTGCMKMRFVFLNAAHQWWWKKNVWTNELSMTSLFSLRWVAFQDKSYRRKFCRSYDFLRVSEWLKLMLSFTKHSSCTVSSYPISAYVNQVDLYWGFTYWIIFYSDVNISADIISRHVKHRNIFLRFVVCSK